nr:serine/threonine-protein phosphatase 7 long form like [Quercus suber]
MAWVGLGRRRMEEEIWVGVWQRAEEEVVRAGQVDGYVSSWAGEVEEERNLRDPTEEDLGPLDFRGHFKEMAKILMLDNRVIDIFKLVGLEGLYRALSREIDHGLISALVERCRPETYTLHLPHGEMSITLQDVEDLEPLDFRGHFKEMAKILMLDNRVIDIFKLVGLEGLYRALSREINHGLISALVERCQPETYTLHLPHGEMSITLQDVEIESHLALLKLLPIGNPGHMHVVDVLKVVDELGRVAVANVQANNGCETELVATASPSTSAALIIRSRGRYFDIILTIALKIDCMHLMSLQHDDEPEDDAPQPPPPPKHYTRLKKRKIG